MSSFVVRTSLVLTAAEEELAKVLVAAAQLGGSTVRIAGGWVRDKALGRETKDVDVALDNCSGVEFAKRIVSLKTKLKFEASNVGVVAANPAQSKHLETATMRVCGLECDFVNLRSETYAAESRIPTAAFGTPHQDAMRRDFTVNALFYNVATREVEDLTGRGLEDLKQGILRTPLEARVTLLDDPLRALRAVRFSARYNFDLEATLREAASTAELREALVAKVSRERVGKEIVGALKTSDQAASRVMDQLRSLGLASTAFGVPDCEVRGTARSTEAEEQASEVFSPAAVDSTSKVWLLSQRRVEAMQRRTKNATPADRVARGLAAALSPFDAADCPWGKKHKSSPLPLAICSAGLKLSGKEGDHVQCLIDASKKFVEFARRHPDVERRDLGNLLFTICEKWNAALDLAYARELAQDGSLWREAVLLDEDPKVKALDDRYDALKTAITGPLNLDNVWSTLKPMFDGRALMNDLGVPKGGRVGQLLAEQRDWQLTHPDGDSAACKAHLLAELENPTRTPAEKA